MHGGVWALSVTAFAIGVAEFIVVGLLPAISSDLGVSLAQSGSLVGLYALALAVGTPVLVLALGKFPRKPVLIGLVAVFLTGNLLSAVASSYEWLLLGRMLTAVAHGSFFAVGAAVAARLAPAGQSSRAIATMFAGLTLAMVIGVPLGSLVGNALGWRLPFFAVAMLATIGLLATICWVPAQARQKTGSTMEQLSTLTRPTTLAMIAITVLGFGGSFAAFTFITPILIEVTGFSAETASLLLVVFGIATLLGNHAGGRLSSVIGWSAALKRMLIGLCLVLIGVAAAMPYKTAMLPVLFLWGALAFGISPGLQAGMLKTAERWSPGAVDFASALNISAFNLGITLGQTLGSHFVAHELMTMTPWVGVVLVALAQWPLLWLTKQHARSSHTRWVT